MCKDEPIQHELTKINVFLSIPGGWLEAIYLSCLFKPEREMVIFFWVASLGDEPLNLIFGYC